MIKSTIFNVWLSDNSRVNISSKYDFDEEFDIIFKETTTGLSIYKTTRKLSNQFNTWYQPGPLFSIIDGISIEISNGENLLHEEVFEFGNLKVSLDKKISYDKNDINSWAPFFEVFICNSYEDDLVKFDKDDIVVDLGANIGMFSLYASPKSKQVYSVEPLPETYENLVKNVEHLNNVKTLNKAIYSEADKLEFIKNECSIASSIFAKQSNYEKIVVDVIPFEDFLKLYNIDRINYLKVDIEGSEFDLFENMDEKFLENNVDKIFMEIHIMNDFKLDDILDKVNKYFVTNLTDNGKDKYGVHLYMLSGINKLIK